MKAGNEDGGGGVEGGVRGVVASSIMRRVYHDDETVSRTKLGEFGFEVGDALFECHLRLSLLDAAERDVGDLRTVPVGDFEALLLSRVAHTITDHAVAKLRSIIAAYAKQSTRRHVDIGVHVREMLTE